MQRRHALQILRRVVFGALCGYIAYVPAMVLTMYALDRRMDTEKILYRLYDPLMPELLLAPSVWKGPVDFLIPLILALGFMLAGVCVALFVKAGPKTARGR